MCMRLTDVCHVIIVRSSSSVVVMAPPPGPSANDDTNLKNSDTSCRRPPRTHAPCIPSLPFVSKRAMGGSVHRGQSAGPGVDERTFSLICTAR
jgi:hypothetical protein